MIERINEIGKKIEKDIINNYHYLHANPELSFEEYNTSKFILEHLKKLKIKVTRYAQTGIVCIIEGEKKGDTIALRADMDALPIIESKKHKIRSKKEGIMHACGHDFHMSVLLGVATILSEIKNSLKGSIMLIFQPGEEKLPGGAKKMIEEGIFNNEKPKWIGAIHCDPSIKTGHIGLRKGLYMASGDEIFITVKAKGGHAAMPHKTADTVLIASEIIVALQQISSRHCPPQIPCVLTFGKIVGNGAVNIIPKEVKIEGTFRTMNEEWRTKAKELIKTISTSIAESHGAKCFVEIIDGYPFLKNDYEYTTKVETIAKSILKKEQIEKLDIRMTTEDFAYYSQIMKSTFFRVGVKNNKNNNYELHSSNFIIDEKALKQTSTLLSYICFQLINNNSII